MSTALKYMDLAIQALLMGAISLSIVYSAITCIPGYMAVSLFLALPLGLWQIVSAMLTSMARDSYVHGLYAFGAICYCLIMVGMIYFYDGLGASSLIKGIEYSYLIFCLPPTVGAFWYLDRSFKDCQSK